MIRSLADFTNELEGKFDGDEYLFRGQPDDSDLIPKLARLNLPNILGIEQILLEEFSREALPYLERPINNTWDILAMAQHHGLPTRLLDWSTNPLVALWFAVRENPRKDKNGIVWIYNTSINDSITSTTKPFSENRTKIFRPTHFTRRIIAQAGWFTCHTYREDKKLFIALNRSSLYKTKVQKLIIDPAYFQRLQWELDRCGINYSSMFPDLDGLCRKITWKHCQLDKTEAYKEPLT